MDGRRGTSSTVVRAFSILGMLASRGRAGASLNDVAGWLGMSKSTAHRYLTTLEELEVVERNDKDLFRLGLGLLQLAGALLADHDLRTVSEPFLHELAARAEETVHLAVALANEVVYVAKVDGPHSIRMASRIGSRMPMYCTALGKAMLAYSPRDRLDRIIADGMPSRTPYTLSSAQALYAEMERVRDVGFSTDDQENELGVRCVGAPIFDYTSSVIGAISVSGPASRITRERGLELGVVTREIALAISRRMGYPVQRVGSADLRAEM